MKIVDGGWFSLAVGGVILGLMLCWRRGALEVRHRLQEKSMPLEQFVDNIDRMVVARPPGMGVWLTKVAHGASPVLLHHVKHNSVMHQTVILMTIVADRRPRVPFGERLRMERARPRLLSHPGCGSASCRRRTFPWRSRTAGSQGLDADLDHVHYYIAHEIVVRRAKNSAMAAVPFAIFAFLTPHCEPGARLFQDPAERPYRGGLPRRDLIPGT